jgi:hypothetical protein
VGHWGDDVGDLRVETARDGTRLRLKLRIDLVPEELWGKNLRSSAEGLGQYRWKKLRDRLVQESDCRCAICGCDQSPHHGHEIWKYKETKTIGLATLVRVEAICVTCHNITHWGNSARWISNEGRIAMRKHFCRVNSCKQIDFDRHAHRQFAIWDLRNQLHWQVDWGPFAVMVNDAKQARAWRQHELRRYRLAAASDAQNLGRSSPAVVPAPFPPEIEKVFASLTPLLSNRQTWIDGRVKLGRPRLPGEGKTSLERHRWRKRVERERHRIRIAEADSA